MCVYAYAYKHIHVYVQECMHMQMSMYAYKHIFPISSYRLPGKPELKGPGKSKKAMLLGNLSKLFQVNTCS